MARAHPRLLPQFPVLDRGGNEVQIGTDDGVIVRGIPQVRTALRLLDGHHSVSRIVALSGLSRVEVDALLARLRAAGLVLPDRVPRPDPLVRLLGSGVLARAFAEAYAESAPGRLLLVEPAPPRPGLYEHPRPTGAESLRAHLQSRGFTGARCTSHWYQPEGPVPALTVIAYDRLECDRAITDTLVRADQPHLFLRPLSNGIVVGPFVDPGATCCMRCMDLVRMRDRAWPRLLLQLCRTEWSPPGEVMSWAVATALLQVRTWLAGRRPEAWSATLEVRIGGWAIEQRHWPHHPDCGCGELGWEV